MNAKAISANQKVTGCQRGCVFVFGCVFLFIGAALFWSFFLSPALQSWAAQKWPQAPCVILSSSVKTHSGSDGDTYSPEIRYRYSLDGGDFTADRYSFSTASVSGNWARSVVAQFPVGSNAVCYYNPKIPSEAVLNPNLDRPAYFGLLLLIFVAAGIGIVVFAIWGFGSSKPWLRRASNASGLGAENSLADNDSARFEGPQKLKPVESRLGKALGIGLFALIWNVVISFFVAQLFNGAGWFQILFLLPFLAVGAGTIVATIYQLMALANPTVEVALSNGAVPLGQSIDVAWQLRGRIGRVRSLSLSVQATEQATYTRGTSTYTDKSVFKTIKLFAGSDRQEIEFGTRSVQIPSETMHTFNGSKNEIIWTIQLQGEIPWWPDIIEAFEFFVKPAAPP